MRPHLIGLYFSAAGVGKRATAGMRFENEVELSRYFGGQMRHINRPGSATVVPHPFEDEFDYYAHFSHEVDNNGALQHLEAQAIHALDCWCCRQP